MAAQRTLRGILGALVITTPTLTDENWGSALATRCEDRLPAASPQVSDSQIGLLTLQGLPEKRQISNEEQT